LAYEGKHVVEFVGTQKGKLKGKQSAIRATRPHPSTTRAGFKTVFDASIWSKALRFLIVFACKNGF
jgi:hypothetical protein